MDKYLFGTASSRLPTTYLPIFYGKYHGGVILESTLARKLIQRLERTRTKILMYFYVLADLASRARPRALSYSYYMNYAEVLKVILIHRIRLNLLTDYGRKFEVEYRVLI